MSCTSGPSASSPRTAPAPVATTPVSQGMETPASTDRPGDKTPAKATNLVMQIILRRDLMTDLGWPLGPMMAQAAHAATAVQHLHASTPEMQRYLAGDDGRGWEAMRKAVLEVPDEAALRGLAAKLEAAGVPHHLWIEEPEHIPTALALVPNKRPKSVKRILDDAGCALWK